MHTTDETRQRSSWSRWRHSCDTRRNHYCNLTVGPKRRQFCREFFFTKKREDQSVTMNITPFLRTPFTDAFSAVWTFQNHRNCARSELDVVDCMEAYGAVAGREKCRVLLGDFRECLFKSKRNARTQIMRDERARQYKEGERKERFAEDTPVDSY